MNKKTKSLLKIVFSVALLTWIFWKLDWSFIAEELKTLNSAYLLLFLLCQLGAMLLSVKKWQGIARYQHLNFSLWEGLKIYLTGTFINNFLPSTIGGDIYRSVWLVRQGGEGSKAFSTVLFDRCTGLFMTLLLTLVMGFFVWQEVVPLPHFLTVSYLVVAGSLVFFCATVFFIPRNLVARVPWGKLRSLFQETLLYRDVGIWLQASGWSTAFIFLGLGISNYILFLSLGYALPILPFFGLVSLMALFVSLPISINNIGVKEGAYGVLFVLLGVSFETAVTVALLSRVLQTGLSLLALPVYLLEKSHTQTLQLQPESLETPIASAR